jgi:transcriptional regulator with XRE-family HTH domain
MTENTISWDSIRADMLADPTIKAEYDLLDAEFSIASVLIALRTASGLTQREFAKKVGMKQSQLARIESGKQIPKLETLAKLAAGAGYRVEVNFIPLKGKEAPKIQPLQIAVPDIDAEMSSSSVSLVTKFLESDDPVAVRVRERLGERSFVDVASDLEKCLSLPEEDRSDAVMDIFAASDVTARGMNRDSSDDNDGIELVELVDDLLEKLAEIFGTHH